MTRPICIRHEFSCISCRIGVYNFNLKNGMHSMIHTSRWTERNTSFHRHIIYIDTQRIIIFCICGTVSAPLSPNHTTTSRHLNSGAWRIRCGMHFAHIACWMRMERNRRHVIAINNKIIPSPIKCETKSQLIITRLLNRIWIEWKRLIVGSTHSTTSASATFCKNFALSWGFFVTFTCSFDFSLTVIFRFIRIDPFCVRAFSCHIYSESLN